jgi:hypothetical protein
MERKEVKPKMKVMNKYNEQAERIISDLRLAVARARDDVDQIDDDVELTECTYHYGEGKPIYQRATGQETAEEVGVKAIKQALLDMLTQTTLIIAQTRQKANNQTNATNMTINAINTDIEITQTVAKHSKLGE